MVSTRGSKAANKQGTTTRGGNGGQSSPLLELTSEPRLSTKTPEKNQKGVRKVNIRFCNLKVGQ